VLKESSGRSATRLRHNRVRALLVISEIALALVLLIGAALMIRSFAGLRSLRPGFETPNVLTLKTSLSSPRFKTTANVVEMSGSRPLGSKRSGGSGRRPVVSCCRPKTVWTSPSNITARTAKRMRATSTGDPWRRTIFRV
jgi:hypothetical protein